MSKKKNQSVKIVNELEFPGGIIVRTIGKGKMKGQNISVSQEPANIFGPNIKRRNLATKGNKEMLIEKTSNGYKAI